MKNIALFSLFIFFFASNTKAQTIDADLSKVEFKIGNFWLNKVSGTFTGMNGSITFDEENLKNSHFEVCITSSSINTNNEKRDAHLKNEDFFDVENFPTICFASTSIEKTTKGYKAIGNLTLLKSTKLEEIEFVYTNGKFEGELTINRFEYGLGKGANKFSVGKNAKIKLLCVSK